MLVLGKTYKELETRYKELEEDYINIISVKTKIENEKIKYKIGKNVVETKIVNFFNIEEIPWSEFEIDFVIEASGFFLKMEQLENHIKDSKRKVILTAPSVDIPMFVYGVNDYLIENQKIISNASCTTNCLAPLVKILNDNFGVEEALMTTIHSVTSSQRVVDTFGKKSLRLSRSCNNIIPSSTGAAKAVSKIIPELENKITGMAIRVPILDVSLVDLTIKLKKETNLQEIFNKINNSKIKNIIKTTNEEIVSSDMIGNKNSCVVDEKSCIMLNNTFFKIIAWYDNEWGYCERVADLLKVLESK